MIYSHQTGLFSRTIYRYNSTMNKLERPIIQRRPMSRRTRSRIATLIVLILAVWALSGRLNYLPQAQGSDQQRYHQQTFAVVKVVDGDTIDIDMPDGNKPYTRVRLWGVDTPETKYPGRSVMYYGPEACAFVKELVEGKEVTVCLEPFEKSRGKYGRLLAYVYLLNGRMLNEELISQGYGYADERFDHVMKKEFLQLQKQAQREKRGLWQEERPDQRPQWYRKRHDEDYSSD